MAITTMDGVVAGLAVGKNISFATPSFSATTGLFFNLHRSGTSHVIPTPAVASSGGTLHASTDAGFFNLPSPSGTRYLARVKAISGIVGFAMLYDRIWSCSGFSGTVNTAQSVTGFPTLTRPDANGTGLEIWLEIYTSIGSSASNLTVQYTNQSGVSGRNTAVYALPASMGQSRMARLILQSGDTGVRSIQSVTLSASTGTSGNFGITLVKPIGTFDVASGIQTNDFVNLGFPKTPSDAALCATYYATTGSSSGSTYIDYTFIEG